MEAAASAATAAAVMAAAPAADSQAAKAVASPQVLEEDKLRRPHQHRLPVLGKVEASKFVKNVAYVVIY